MTALIDSAKGGLEFACHMGRLHTADWRRLIGWRWRWMCITGCWTART